MIMSDFYDDRDYRHPTPEDREVQRRTAERYAADARNRLAGLSAVMAPMLVELNATSTLPADAVERIASVVEGVTEITIKESNDLSMCWEHIGLYGYESQPHGRVFYIRHSLPPPKTGDYTADCELLKARAQARTFKKTVLVGRTNSGHWRHQEQGDTPKLFQVEYVISPNGEISAV